MPPPLFVLCIPGVAFFFLIQMLLCQAYHFHVSVARHKNRSSGTKDQRPHRKDDQSPTSKGAMKNKPRGGSQDERRSERDSEPHSRSQNPKRPTFEIPQDKGGSNPENPDFADPKEDRLKVRRKSVFAESYDPAKDDEDIKIVHPKTPEEKQWLIDNLGKIILFQHLAKDQIETVVDAMYKNPVSEGDFIMKQGDKGSTFYVVQTGLFDVMITDPDGVEQLMATYDNKGSFGELALLYNQPRAATIVAQTDGVLWAVDGQTFRRIVHKITHQKRMMYESLINNVPMLKSLQPHERANLVDALVPVNFQHDEEIIKQGEEGDGMYFIISGGVKIIMRTSNGKEILLKELGNSEYFGELALVTDKPRAASAFSVGTTHLAFLDREAFERLLGPCMDLIRRNIDNYNDRLSEILREDDSNNTNP